MIDKYRYIRATPTWIVRLLYVCGFASWMCAVWGYLQVLGLDPFFTWFVLPIVGLFTLYHALSFGINMLYRQFDLAAHTQRVAAYWRATPPPTVDVFLPICGEDMAVLRNTWTHVAQLNYPNYRVFVLDDSKKKIAQHRYLAEKLGFTYVERPNKGEMKKAGNLKYTYERTDGEFIVIFDADFAPHPDFIRETLPYTADPSVGIVQTPQYFDTSRATYRATPLAYAAAYQEEFFYRIIQVAKDRLNAAICCGSNAVYRRAALETIGGPRQVTASEDSRTGYALLSNGWVTRYIPVILAIGICPDTAYAYYHQQHRWCRGRSELVLSHEFRHAPVSWMTKVSNATGFLSFLLRPFELMLSLQLFWVLFLYNDSVSFSNALVFYPYILFSFVLMPLMHIIPFKKEVFFASTIQMYASTHSVITVLFGRTVEWISTNARHTAVSSAFVQTTRLVTVVVCAYVCAIVIGMRTGDLQLTNYHYWSVQFWIVWNLTLSGVVLWHFRRTIANMQAERAKK